MPWSKVDDLSEKESLIDDCWYIIIPLYLYCMLQHIGCDGVLGSGAKEDKCGVCAGNNTSCHIISGIFTRRNLPDGYVKVATIPKRACHINITEMFPTRNYLGL